MPRCALLRVCLCGAKKSKRSKSKEKRKARLNQVTPSMETKLRNLEIVLKELECPVCFNTCVTPVTCVNGHIICNKCRKSVTLCPTCREQFSNVRNLFAENFIDQYSQGCKFAKDGCKFLRWKGDDMSGHHSSCPYRMLKCLVPSCQANVSYRSLLEHLKEVHAIGGTTDLPVTIHYVTDNEFPVRDRKWLPYYILAFGCTFYIMLEIARPFFWIWVWVHCPKAELTERFNFVTTLKLQSSKNMILEWQGPVYPIRVSAAAIIRDGLCFGGPDSLLQHFERDGDVILNVDIRKVPGGFSDGSVSDDGPSVIESEMLATGDIERERNFSQLLIAASNQLIRRASTIDRENNINPRRRSRSGSSRSRSQKSARNSD